MFYSPRLRLKINRAQATWTLYPCDSAAMSVPLAVCAATTGRGAGQSCSSSPGPVWVVWVVVSPHILWGLFHESFSDAYWSQCLKTLRLTPVGDADVSCPAGQAGEVGFLTCHYPKLRGWASLQNHGRSSVFCLFLEHPSQAVLFCWTKSSFLCCCLVFACIKGEVCLEVWLYISGKTVSELGCWCAARAVAEPSIVNHLLQSFMKFQVLWCFVC